MDSEELGTFVESWGSLGVLWGINRSMARVHAFLMVSEEPVDADRIASALNISRGNVSMSLKELRNWGVVQRVHMSGDRRDFYIAEPETWKTLYRIVVGRKAREFDPALHALRRLLSEAAVEEGGDVHRRLTEIKDILTILDDLVDRFLESENRARTMLELLRSQSR